MKTQMVKNAVIVPVGSKGGFVLKGEVPRRPALDEYLIDRYREFVSGLLDVTDNRADGKVLHPPEVVRLDGDDPYLVVAADKGTAHLSDTANSVSAQYGFWLGDAFASGGSVGYDHKKMGITARGAWECVKHHFRNMGIDVQTQPVTVAGVGDMSGDVFGNGVLLSRAIKLVAAFDHRNIFIDPDPDSEASFKERERLFELPRSSWRDYDQKLLSAGGGIYDRSAKAVPLSAQARKLLEIEAEAPSGEEVIRKILTARVDLLYNGGIGTYVKSEAEEHADVGDRANDRVRVNGHELRARVVGEGGNLGFTQKGRLEFWAAGGRLNTDAVDNSGGVDTSDHEVNIKILLDQLVKRGLIKGRDERNRILAEMTDDVARLVLADNDGQALALSLDGLRSARRYEEFVALVDDMVGAGAARPPGRVGAVARGARREPAPRARAAAAAALRAARLLEDVGLPAAARERLPGQRRRASLPRRLLPAAAARAFRRALLGARAAPRDRRHLRRQLPGEPRRHPAAAPARAGRPPRDRRGGLRLDRGRPRGGGAAAAGGARRRGPRGRGGAGGARRDRGRSAGRGAGTARGQEEDGSQEGLARDRRPAPTVSSGCSARAAHHATV